MIIVPSDDDKKRTLPTTTIVEVQSEDPPPTYTAQSPPPPPPVAGASTAAPKKHHAVKPSNYVSISRHNGSVKDTWVLDPALVIPSSLLPPLSADETEDTRRNMNLKASNGAIEADITIAPFSKSEDSKSPNSRRTTIHAKTSNGGVKVKVHDASTPRLPLYINAYASNGSVNIHLPRSFRGLLSIRTSNGSSKFSAEASGHLTTFSDVDGTRRCFIGDYSDMTDSWEGDEVVAEAKNGSVKIVYDDEEQEKSERKSGFFGRLFGL